MSTYIEFENEKELQVTYSEFLENNYNHNVTQEAKAGEKRADIVTDNLLIECKHRLTCDNAYKGIGQLNYYSTYYPNRKNLMVVESVKDDNAIAILNNAGVPLIDLSKNRAFKTWATEIGYLDTEPEPVYRSSYSNRNYENEFDFGEFLVNNPWLSIIGVFFALLVAAGGAGNHNRSTSRVDPTLLIENESSIIYGKITPSQSGYKAVNLRGARGTQFEIIEVLMLGDSVVVLETTHPSGWIKVRTDGNIGYVSENQITIED